MNDTKLRGTTSRGLRGGVNAVPTSKPTEAARNLIMREQKKQEVGAARQEVEVNRASPASRRPPSVTAFLRRRSKAEGGADGGRQWSLANLFSFQADPTPIRREGSGRNPFDRWKSVLGGFFAKDDGPASSNERDGATPAEPQGVVLSAPPQRNLGGKPAVSFASSVSEVSSSCESVTASSRRHEPEPASSSASTSQQATSKQPSDPLADVELLAEDSVAAFAIGPSTSLADQRISHDQRMARARQAEVEAAGVPASPGVRGTMDVL